MIIRTDPTTLMIPMPPRLSVQPPVTITNMFLVASLSNPLAKSGSIPANPRNSIVSCGDDCSVGFLLLDDEKRHRNIWRL